MFSRQKRTKLFPRQNLNEAGALHYILPLLVVVLVAVTGVGYMVVTHANPAPSKAAAAAATPPVMPFGLYESTNNLQYSFPTTPNYAIQYYGWQEGFQTADANAAESKHTEPFIEMQTCGNPCNAATGIPITDVTSGKYDTYLKSFATSIKAFNHPVLLTFDHEMNGSWYPWGSTEVTAAQWRAAWQHVVGVMRPIAPNFTTVWAPNIEQGAVSVKSYWPGVGYPAAHVDDIALDGYFQTTGSTWANTFGQSVTDLKAVGGSRTFIVAETGVPAADSNNVAQINNLIAGARSAKAKAVVYFDSGSKWSFTTAGQKAFVTDVK